MPAEEARHYLDKKCGNEPTVRKAVEQLLDADRDSAGFMTEPAAQQAASLIAEAEEKLHEPLSIGPYRTTQLLGFGGMGLVYQAERVDGEFKQVVAIKRMRSIIRNPEMRKQFLAERQILAGLQHPAIGHLLDGGVTDDGHPYFALEYIDGEPITAYCTRVGADLKRRLELFLQVCDAVAYAHSRLVIHQDLKPSNILITRIAPRSEIQKQSTAIEHQVKLLDFGIARLMKAKGELTPIIHTDVYTPEYAAPEQVLGEDITAATDIFTLGLLLHELLTDKRARTLPQAKHEEIAGIVSDELPPQPSAVANADSPFDSRQIKGDLDAIVMKAASKAPQDRYLSVSALAEDVRRCIAHQPVTARGNEWSYRTGKFFRRYRWGAFFVITLLMLLAALVTSTVLSNQKITAALQTAQHENVRATEVTRFLQELFEVADPFASDGEKVTVLELLNRGAERISTELSGQPDTQSQLMFELARIHNSLGFFVRASELFAEALVIQRNIHKAGSEIEAATLHWHSIVFDNLGAYEKSEKSAEAALAMRLAVLGDNHPDTAESKDRLASLLAYTGQKERALDLSRQAVDTLNRTVGVDDSRTQTARHNLAWMLGRQAFYDEATPIYETVIEVANRVAGPDHPETLETLNNFAVMLRHKGDTERAEKIYRRVLEKRLELLGNKHPQVGYSQNNLAKLLQEKGEWEEAHLLYEQSHTILMQSYGAEHDNIAISLTNMAQVLMALERVEEAELMYQDAMRIHRSNTPGGNTKVAATLQGLGYLLSTQGNFADAEPMLREALQYQQNEWPGGHVEVAITQLRLGQLLAMTDRQQLAQELLELSSLALARRYGDSHSLTVQARNSLASSYPEDRSDL